ncbi:uncharacterized protein LOC132707151 [Cylas formicarius]|uniref:uncharacterized protein LOC132707151 n=1 Tax=Cylas formicarius TaxID=197179 RepID=UPI002958B183|nr:uncharacterized protein LOC132707151 [Cylas formicarius]XP_060534852.1 uncharacterized protein LOC132707151 [Cylas formicarius]
MESEDSFLGQRLAQDHWFVSNTLVHIFKYLDFSDVLRASRVCTLWNQIDGLWSTVQLRNYNVHLNGLVVALEKHSTSYLQMSNCNIYVDFTYSDASYLEPVASLTKLDVHDCRTLDVWTITKTANGHSIPSNFPIEIDYLRLDFLKNFPNLIELSVRCTYFDYVPNTFQTFRHLRSVSFRGVRYLADCNLSFLCEMESLRSLALGDCNSISDEFALNLLPNLTHLEKLTLEKCSGRKLRRVFGTVERLPNLVEICLVDVVGGDDFSTILCTCPHLKTIVFVSDSHGLYEELGVPAAHRKISFQNYRLFEAIVSLKGSLESFTWGFRRREVERVTEGGLPYVPFPKGRQAAKYFRNTVPRNEVFFVTLDELQKAFSSLCSKTRVQTLVYY